MAILVTTLWVAVSVPVFVDIDASDETSEAIEQFARSVEAAGGSIEPIGIPGHFLTFRNVPVFEVTIDRKWNSKSLDLLDNDHLAGIRLTKDAEIGAGSFSRLCDFSQLGSMTIEYGRRATTWDLSQLGKLQRLWSLSIVGSRFSDERLKTIGELKQLRILSIADSRISNESGKLIRELFPALIHLSVKRSAIKSPISTFVPNDIEVLSLRGFQLTGEDAEFIMRLPRLRILDLRDGRNSPEVLDRIREQRKIQLVLSEGHFGLK